MTTPDPLKVQNAGYAGVSTVFTADTGPKILTQRAQKMRISTHWVKRKKGPRGGNRRYRRFFPALEVTYTEHQNQPLTRFMEQWVAMVGDEASDLKLEKGELYAGI